MSDRGGTKRILVSDQGGDGGRFALKLGKELGAEVKVFRQPGLLYHEAVLKGADLLLVFGPDSLEWPERLRNDAHTRDIPLLLASSQLDDPEQLFLALDAADQIIDYPFEEDSLRLWVERGLRREFGRATGQEFAEARLHEPGTSRWSGRVSWVSDNRMRFETDLVLPEGIDVQFEGPLLHALGETDAVAHVVARSREDVHYNHELRLTLELERAAGRPPLSALVRGNPEFSAPMKLKIAVVAAESRLASVLADALDTSRFSLRWIADIEQLAKELPHQRPALVVIDPAHPDLGIPARVGTVLRAAKAGLHIVPLTPPASAQPWDKLGPQCPVRDVPALRRNAGWTELLARWAQPHESDRDPGRVFLRRDHAFSHGRIAVPCTLVSLTEAGGAIELAYPLGPQARARLDVPALAAASVRPPHGRVMRASKAKERVPLVWMGVGDEEHERRLRFFVHERIIAQRRRELEAGDH